MVYDTSPIAAAPSCANPLLQHALDIYAGETNKTYSMWNEFAAEHLGYKPHERASSVLEIFRHQLLSERRFFSEFLGLPEVAAEQVLPQEATVGAFSARLVELARPRLDFLAAQADGWWLARVKFFDVERERIWIFWRRVLHSAHHRTQLGVYLRMLDKRVPSTYGPTADVTWTGADPTRSVDAAKRK
jgi:uncharacterized damage-inducible protein DinB